MSYVYLSKKDIEGKYRMALTKLQNAAREIEYLDEGEYGDTLRFTLGHLEEAIGSLKHNRDQAAEKYKFTPKEGI